MIEADTGRAATTIKKPTKTNNPVGMHFSLNLLNTRPPAAFISDIGEAVRGLQSYSSRSSRSQEPLTVKDTRPLAGETRANAPHSGRVVRSMDAHPRLTL